MTAAAEFRGRASLVAGMSVVPRKIARTHVVTAVWGDWHVDAYLKVGLPSLVAPDNLPNFFRRIDAQYIIYTRASDAPRITAAPIFKTLQTLGEVHLVTPEDARFRGSTLDDHIANHHRLWDRATEEAGKDQALAMLIPPDVCWADGALAHVASLLEQGKRAIYCKAVRVTEDTFTPVLHQRHRDVVDGTIRIRPRELVALGIEHSHPLLAMNVVGCSHTPGHSELLIHPVPGEGYLMPLLCSDGFVIDATLPSLLGFNVPTERMSPTSVAICADSDELCAVSLTPLTKDPDWWYEPRPLEPIRVATWWGAHDIPDSTLLYSTPFRFAAVNPSVERWSRARVGSDRLVRRVRMGFHVINIVRGCVEALGARRSAIIAASLYNAPWLRRRLQLDEPLTIIVPSDASYRELPDWLWDQGFSSGKHARSFQRLVADYIIRGAVELEGEDDRSMVAVSGRKLQMRRGPQGLDIEGMPITGSWKSVRGHVLYLVNGLLPVDVTGRT